MDTAQQSTISEAEASLVARGLAAKCDPGKRPEAFVEARARILRASVGKAWESDKHRLAWATEVGKSAVADLYREMNWSLGKRLRVEMSEALPDMGSLPSDQAEESDLREHRRGRLKTAIRRTPPGIDRKIGWQRFFRGRPLRDIGAEIGVSESRICQRAKLILARIQAGLDERPQGVREKRRAIGKRLAPREMEVLQLISSGKTGPEIAIILGIGVPTVRTYEDRIFGKLGVENRWSAALVYLQTSDKNL